VEFRKGEFVLDLDGELVTIERTGVSVINRLRFCTAWGRSSLLGSDVVGRRAGWDWTLTVTFVSSVVSLKLSLSSSSPLELPNLELFTEDSNNDGAKMPAGVFLSEIVFVKGSGNTVSSSFCLLSGLEDNSGLFPLFGGYRSAIEGVPGVCVVVVEEAGSREGVVGVDTSSLMVDKDCVLEDPLPAE